MEAYSGTWKELKGGKGPIFTTLKRGLQSLVDELSVSSSLT